MGHWSRVTVTWWKRAEGELTFPPRVSNNPWGATHWPPLPTPYPFHSCHFIEDPPLSDMGLMAQSIVAQLFNYTLLSNYFSTIGQNKSRTLFASSATFRPLWHHAPVHIVPLNQYGLEKACHKCYNRQSKTICDGKCCHYCFSRALQTLFAAETNPM